MKKDKNNDLLVLQLKIANAELAIEHMKLQQENLQYRIDKVTAQYSELQTMLKAKQEEVK